MNPKTEDDKNLNSSITHITLGFIGAGNMGGALIEGLLQSKNKPKSILVCDHHPEKFQTHLKNGSLQLENDKIALANQANIIVLAVKPQNMVSVLNELKGFDQQRTPLILSVAAGVTLAQIRKGLDLLESYPLIRVMPNMPALIQSGITAMYAPFTNSEYLPQAQAIMEAVGKVVWLQEESQMNLVTALSGSGPAYFYYFVEQLIEGACVLGLPFEIAKELSLHTGLGALTMATNSSLPLSSLRAQVTSRGGTTEAGMEVFIQQKLDAIVLKALTKARERADFLSNSLKFD